MKIKLVLLIFASLLQVLSRKLWDSTNKNRGINRRLGDLTHLDFFTPGQSILKRSTG
jgi:hypothetical protein